MTSALTTENVPYDEIGLEVPTGEGVSINVGFGVIVAAGTGDVVGVGVLAGAGADEHAAMKTRIATMSTAINDLLDSNRIRVIVLLPQAIWAIK
jgi:hypothetical protein